MPRWSFNTASGITQLQPYKAKFPGYTFNFKFQYRKRYYPVATLAHCLVTLRMTAIVSIPQAVTPSCNAATKAEARRYENVTFQYRKRYYPVATVEALEAGKEIIDHIGFQYRKRYYPVATGSVYAEMIFA